MSSPCIFYEGIIHRIINYVDDSSNLVSSKNAKTLQLYMNDYFKLLEEFYNINKLVINPEKVNFWSLTRKNIEGRLSH